jgi:signal transduction histidine kinase
MHENKILTSSDGSLKWFHWLIVASSIVLTLGAWQFSAYQVKEKNLVRYEDSTEKLITNIKERMSHYEGALAGGVALADMLKGNIEYKNWRAYASSLRIDKSYPGINGIGIIYNIDKTEKDAFIAKQRIDRPDWKIHPQHSESEYWPITLIEPEAPNKKAVGLDMAFETNRYSSVKRARDTGKTSLTGPIVLVQDSKKTPGFLLYVPFYEHKAVLDTVEERRNAIIGVTYAPFIMTNLMHGTLSDSNRLISLRLSDGGDPLFDDGDNLIDNKPIFSSKKIVEMYGRKWQFEMSSNQLFRELTKNNQPTYILIAGLFIDTLLFGLFILLARSNKAAVAYAKSMNAELVDKADRLEKSNKDLQEFSYIASHDLKSPLNSIKQLATWIREDSNDSLPDQSKKYLSLLEGRSNRMIKLLSDLLSYSRVGTALFEKENINLNDISTDIIDLLGNPDGFDVKSDDVDIYIQRIPVELILRNLISNSIKHLDKSHGTIEVNYHLDGEYHVLTVSDDGPGIPVEFREKAKEMFQTLKPRDKVEGSGMGLAMINRLSLRLEGSFEIESNEKGQTQFVIRIPL